MICPANTLPTIFAETDIPVGPIPQAAADAVAAMLLDLVANDDMESKQENNND